MNEPTRSQGFGVTDLLLLLTAVIWALNFSVIKYATGKFDPLAFMTVRIVISMLILLGIVLLRDRPRLSRGTWLALLLLGVVGHGMYQFFFINGVARTRAGNAALIVAASPAFIAIAARMRGLERVRRLALAGIALSVAGVALVIIGSGASVEGRATLTGSLLVFVGVICWSFFTVGLQPYTTRVDPIQISAITLVGGAVPLLLVTGPALARQDWTSPGLGGWMAMLYATVLSMVIGYLFWYRGLRVLGATRTAVYGNLQPIIALLAAWMLLGEVPTMWQSIGTATIVCGIFLARL